ncbi:MAG TPA: MSMEG_4193 family putative phosphomutase [Streptosporangiaceae bacterium]|nr:MSMEG_4193 family putative phosphomutase [Streptosporangiaceae bacterium]
MTMVLLVRHGLTALTGPVLAGWTPGVHLDDRGRTQVAALAARLRDLPLTAVVSSPLERCRETAEIILSGRNGTPSHVDERFGEVRYGDWTGEKLETLAKDPLWPVVQAHPSAVRFPGAEGESMPAAQHRAVSAVRDWNGRLGDDAVYLVCSHGDIIKAILADALGLHLDQFQRIQAAPASLSAVRYTGLRPFVVRVNDIGGGVDGLLPPPPEAAAGDEKDAATGADAAGGADRTGSRHTGGDGDAPVGGGA